MDIYHLSATEFSFDSRIVEEFCKENDMEFLDTIKSLKLIRGTIKELEDENKKPV